MKGRPYLFFSAIVAAFGGFLFGFDIAIISGAKQSVQVLWQLPDGNYGLAVTIALYATVLGAILGRIPADRYGRKTTLFWVGILCLVSALGSALTSGINAFIFFRFLGGLAIGACCVTAPKYISELAPIDMRGKLVALFQMNIIFGVVVAFIAIYMFTDMRDDGWRWMLGVEAIPAFVYAVLILLVPRSPRWLIVKKEDVGKAKEILTRIDPAMVDSNIAAIQESRLKKSKSIKSKLFSW